MDTIVPASGNGLKMTWPDAYRLVLGDKIFHSAQEAVAQEAVNPGYLDRIQQRARREWSQDYWYMPGADMEPRAPEFGAAVGQ